ncbi:MAG: nicotinate-nucleotide adenylyltransferase [Acidimicrobiia bacterium]
MRRGILGGTFDPPHVAHLVAAETAYRQLALDVVTLMPAGDPWQKADRRVSAPVHRLAMAELAASGVDYFEVDDREVRRPGPTYTNETIGSFPAEDDIVLVLGADAAAGLAGWHRADEVTGRAGFGVMPRRGVAAAAVEAALHPASPVWLDTPEIAISATEVRAIAARGASIRFLVPDEVWRYVESHRLYSAGL